MTQLGNKNTPVPITTDQLQDGLITTSKLAEETKQASNFTYQDNRNIGANDIQEALDKAIILNDADNRIINGDFGIWQRGTSQSTNGYGSVDRWRLILTGGSGSLARQPFGLGDTLGSVSSSFYARVGTSGQSAASHRCDLLHPIEGVRSYAGETITVLGWARRVTGSGNIVVEAAQDFGTGGSPSTSVLGINPTTVELQSQTIWQPFAAVLNIPSLSGKVLGNNGNDILFLLFWLSAGSDFNARTNSLGIQDITVDFWGIHIRRGVWPASTAALYRPRHPAVELALCQRYYERDNSDLEGSLFWSGNVSSGSTYYTSVPFLVQKRATPSVSIIKDSRSSALNAISLTVASNNRSFRAQATANQTSEGAFFRASWQADAEL